MVLVGSEVQFEWQYVEPLENAGEVARAVAKSAYNLPAGVVEFLERYNGATPSNSGFRTADGAEQLFNRLFSYNGDLCAVKAAFSRVEDYPMLFPIGSDSFGNLICLNLGRGDIVFFDHETDEIVAVDVTSNPGLFGDLARLINSPE